MASQHQGRATITILAVVAVGVVIALMGVLNWDSGAFAPSILSRWTELQAPPTRPPEQKPAPVAPSTDHASPAPAAPATAPPETPSSPPSAPPPASSPNKAAEGPVVPSFDLVRVEPDGESVIAGRGAPGATIELLRDGQVHARAAADGSGLFAFVPPPLPPGSHQVMLQSIAPDGIRQRSRESVTIVIDENRTGRPLVALTSPDRPTVVLSNPEQPAQAVAQAEPPKQEPPAPAPQGASPPPPAAPAPAAPRPDVRIASVETEDGGRLFVSGHATPGATVRLYLNETFVAPGGVGADGKVSFAIGRGMKPGNYRVRLDDVDPVSGDVKSRAEVAFNVPVEVAVPLPPPAQPAVVPPPTSVASPAAAPAGSEKQAQVPSPAAEPQSQGQPAAPTQEAPAGARNTRMASAEPREFANSTVVIPDISTAVVSRGDSLWRISQRFYGHGTRFTVIFGANHKQIRNPDLIYPGQVFVLPPEEGRTTQ